MACLLLAVPLLVAQDPSKLSLEYYSKTCPNVEHVVRTEMECAVRADTRNAALMLRLHFHDCFVQVSTLFLFTPDTDQPLCLPCTPGAGIGISQCSTLTKVAC